MDKYQYHIFSPYRVCPLGAHVDHQHGLVTGFAIDKGVDLWFNVREDSLVKLSSRTFEGDVEFHVNTPSQVKERHWGDYARGAKYALRKRFELSHGIEGVIQGSLPVGGAAGVIHTAESAHTDCEPNANVEAMRVALDKAQIEARPVWKPMHKQPCYKDAPAYVNGVSEALFKVGMCLPAGPYVSDDDVKYIVDTIKENIIG